MKFISIIIFLFFNIFSLNIFAQTIAIINLNYLIDNNTEYKSILKQIEIDQQIYLEDFNIKENELKKKLDEIEESKLILTDKEINSQIDQYNNDLNNFSILVEEFNSHYQNQIINIREFLVKQIVLLIQKYANENNVDLVLDSTSYLIASNSLDITSYINEELNKIDLNLEYTNFE